MIVPDFLVSKLDFLSKCINYSIGKGSGSSSILTEIKHTLHLLKKNFSIKNNILVIDIGGNYGEYTSSLRKQFSRSEIHIFEPSEKCFSSLKDRFLKSDNVHINQLAISNINGATSLHANEFGSGLSSLQKRRLDHYQIFFEKSEPVTLIRFEDYWISKLKKRSIDIIKLDVEGHELSALEGMGLAMQSTKLIQFEFGGCNIDSKTYFQDFWYYFKENNFELYRISPIGLIKINQYNELDETFLTTNYIALNNLSFSK